MWYTSGSLLKTVHFCRKNIYIYIFRKSLIGITIYDGNNDKVYDGGFTNSGDKITVSGEIFRIVLETSDSYMGHFTVTKDGNRQKFSCIDCLDSAKALQTVYLNTEGNIKESFQ